jgi:aldose 1-epimerase
MGIEKKPFGVTKDGAPVHLFTLTNANGVEARITNYGGIVVSLRVPDRDGALDDIVLGHDTLGEYIDDDNYFGCIVGRYANRIVGGRFSLNGVEHVLARNDGVNHLHGGETGFNKGPWEAEEVREANAVGLELAYASGDGEEGYPGNLFVRVVYLLTNENELRIEYAAATDRDTVVNLSHHSYFNLAGAGSGDVLGHVIMIDADRFTPVDRGLIPTGELRGVRGTPMDFTEPVEIGARIGQDDEQLAFGGGYDHNWALNKGDGPLGLAARVYEPTAGRVMELYTTEPGVQFFTGNHLEGVVGKAGRVYGRHGGFCLEAQRFPDSPNKPQFPSTVLRAGDRYTQTTFYRFSMER